MLRGRSGRVLRPFPPAIRPEADGNTQTAGTRGAKKQTEGDVKIRETSQAEKSRSQTGAGQINIETEDYKKV